MLKLRVVAYTLLPLFSLCVPPSIGKIGITPLFGVKYTYSNLTYLSSKLVSIDNL